MTTYLSNAFSLNMLGIGADGLQIDIRPVLPAEIPADAVSIIGHSDVATIISAILRRSVEVNRGTVVLQEGDILFVAQYRGIRLPAGTTQLPTDASLEFYCIAIR